MVGGRIRSDLRFANRVTWNTFPLPDAVSDVARERVCFAAAEVLAARELQEGRSLFDMHNPFGMRYVCDSVDALKEGSVIMVPEPDGWAYILALKCDAKREGAARGGAESVGGHGGICRRWPWQGAPASQLWSGHSQCQFRPVETRARAMGRA